MARTNTAAPTYTGTTNEGAPARRMTGEQALRRSVMACMLWEKEFYEDGVSVATRIRALARDLPLSKVSAIAIEARQKHNLRHAPLLLCVAMAERGGAIVGDTLVQVIQRADELSEFVALYWKDGKKPMSKQVKRGLGEAFKKFDEYQLAKYDRATAVRLRDVLFLTHPKPMNRKQAALWKRLANDELATPDTWEVALSGGANKKDTFERLIREGSLGYLALLRNLRTMHKEHVDKALVADALTKGTAWPFRFIAAARAVPAWEDIIEKAMLASMQSEEKADGRTIVLVDVSGSMDAPISAKSDLHRVDAACGVAIVARERYSDVRVFSFSNNLVEIPARHGFALRDAIVKSQSHQNTALGAAVAALPEYDRLIVVTDEQSKDKVPGPRAKGYMVNVASAKNGVGYGPWVHVDGWSEAVLDYIREHEEAK